MTAAEPARAFRPARQFPHSHRGSEVVFFCGRSGLTPPEGGRVGAGTAGAARGADRVAAGGEVGARAVLRVLVSLGPPLPHLYLYEEL